MSGSIVSAKGEVSKDGSTKGESTKKKSREERATKVVIRKLPPTMKEEEFLEQVSPLPEYNYLNFVPADEFDEFSLYSRAYINFYNINDTVIFSQQFDNYVFIDGKGEEYSAVVELAPFQRIPKLKSNRKKDPLCGTIIEDPVYLQFLEEFTSVDEEISQPLNENFFDLPEIKPREEIEKTPLQEFLISRNKEWQKFKDDKKEERRLRELERKKQKEEMKKRINKERDLIDMAEKLQIVATNRKERRSGNYTKKDIDDKLKYAKQLVGMRVKGGKSYQEERLKDLAKNKKNEDKLADNKSNDAKGVKNNDLHKSHLSNDIDDKISLPDKSRGIEPLENTDGKNIEQISNIGDKDVNYEINETENEPNDEYTRKQNGEIKACNNIAEKGRLINKKHITKKYSYEHEKRMSFDRNKYRSKDTNNYYDDRKYKSSKSGGRYAQRESYHETKYNKPFKSNYWLDKKPYPKHNSYENRTYEKKLTKKTPDMPNTENINERESEDKPRTESNKENSVPAKSEHCDNEVAVGHDNCNGLKQNQISDTCVEEDKRNALLKNKSEAVNESAGIDDNSSQLTENEAVINKLKGKSENNSRAERRIKNKDRPTIELYRPGMGKFSRQRFEQRKNESSVEEK